MFIETLKYGFLIIFFATAIIGLASIPGWIKVPEWYRKRIFIALVLEVVGAIIILFHQEFIEKSSDIPRLKVSHEDWIALNDKGLIVKPVITITTRDTLITRHLGSQTHREFVGLKGKAVENGLSILNADNLSLGRIAGSDLEESGLFNSFKTAKNEITSTNNYAYIKWEKRDNGNWIDRGSFIGPFELEIYDYSDAEFNGTYYRIRNTEADKYIFDSKSFDKDLFSVDNRIIHFLKYENAYYLLRIAWADLQKDQPEKYVHVINVKLQPSFEGRN